MGPDLVELAALHGVATEYVDQSGVTRYVDERTVLAVLGALGVDVSTPERVAVALENRRLRDWRRTLPPVVVVRQGDPTTFWVHVPHWDAVRPWIELESGGIVTDITQVDRWVEPAWVDARLTGEATFEVPRDLPTGWHRLHVETSGSTGVSHASTTLVVTPRQVPLPASLGHRRVWGFAAQIYSVRSHASWGLGDLGDLAQLAAWSGRSLGADFVLVNPLHAASPLPPMAPSPYLPVTRRYPNPIYVRVEAIPEFSELTQDQQTQVEVLRGTVRPSNDTSDLLDRDRVWLAKRMALEIVGIAGLGLSLSTTVSAWAFPRNQWASECRS